MANPVPIEYQHHSRNTHNFGAIYSAVALLSFHWALVLYVNSSFLEQFIDSTKIGLLYMAGSVATIVTFLWIARLLHTTGNYNLTLVLTLAEFAALIGLATVNSPILILLLFMIHQAIIPVILFNLDVFMEEMIGENEGTTGGKRGLFLGMMSFAGALAPLSAGFLIGGDVPHFGFAYIASALLLIPFLGIIMYFFKTFKDPYYSDIKVLPAIKCFFDNKDIRNVFFAHFLLQFFFAWMVIYTPIYLSVHLGYDWTQIGIILFIGLMAYVFFEYPIGIIADRWIGEKEMMALGFVIIGVSTSWFTFLGTATLGAWMFAMFMTRVGASFVESTTESYFFKHIDGSDANIISFFRISRPLAYGSGAILGSLTLFLVPFNLLFTVLGLLMIPGLFFTMALKDTK